ncbi:FecR family protein [Seonamhaeicola sp.]|uniref:FecR family protein n=1 Tax=Seonamhaeicola sp. TaxID=1912245 RepID=UPI00262B2CAE|nr:FecR family protein [Seonamhaeicola sp.]
MNKEEEYLKIARLIASEFNLSISDENRKKLYDWLNESAENRDIYNEIKRDGWYQSMLDSNNEYEIQEGWNKLNSRIKSKSKVVKLLPSIWKYAAAVVVVFGLGYYFKDYVFNQSVEDDVIPAIVDTNEIVPGTDKATLTLEDGSQIALEKGASFQTSNAKSNGEQIIYDAGDGSSKELVYNYLTIPRGGQYYIVLSDGTKVWLNSESQLKYPVAFIDNIPREVELVYGEAYFDVSPSLQHKGAKFKVLNKSQEVEVLGTEFNIKAYSDETNVYTTLVEGKVAVDFNGKKQNLLPGHQSNLDLKNNEVSVSKVDVNVVVAWKNGIFSFRGKSLKDIMKVISRWYDVDIVFENKELEQLKFKGVLDKRQSIEEILSIMKSTTINNYEIKDKTIILK